MREAGHTAVEVESLLQPLSGEVFDYKSANKEAEARSDIKCCGFWSKMRQAYFDVKVVNPFARSYAPKKPAALFRSAENSKMGEYRERRDVERPTIHLFWWNGSSESFGVEATRRVNEQEAEPATFCCVWRVTMQTELCSSSRDTSLCACNTSQERSVGQHRAGSQCGSNGVLNFVQF